MTDRLADALWIIYLLIYGGFSVAFVLWAANR